MKLNSIALFGGRGSNVFSCLLLTLLILFLVPSRGWAKNESPLLNLQSKQSIYKTHGTSRLGPSSLPVIPSGGKGQRSKPYLEGEVLVVLDPYRPRAAAQSFATQGYRPIHLKSNKRRLGGYLYKFKIPNYQTVEHAVDSLSRHPDVRHVQPNYVYRRTGPFKTLLIRPVDTDYPRQWYLQRAEDTPAINAPRAWTQLTGDSTITVAVVDQGIDTDHPDIQSRLSIVKQSDVADSDDDPNAQPVPRDMASGVCQTAPVENSGPDTEFHGTHVGGVIGSVWNNQFVTGVDRNANIMPLRVFDWFCDSTVPVWVSRSTSDSVAEGIRIAAQRGADVINLSLGGTPSLTGDKIIESALQVAHDSGIVIVAASGNSGSSTVSFPASADTTIAVGAYRSPPSALTVDRASFSNYGDTLDLMAPGIDIYSLVPDEVSGGAGFVSGTSQAAPIVSAAASLVKARHPDSSVQQLESLLLASTQALGSPAQQGRNQFYGQGLIDLVKLAVDPLPSPSGIPLAYRVDPINRIPQGFSSLVNVPVDDQDTFVQVDLNYSDTTTGNLIVTAKSESGFNHHVSLITSVGDTLQISVWTTNPHSSIFLGRRSDIQNLDSQNLPAGIPDTEKGLRVMGRVGLLLEFSDNSGELLGNTTTTTNISDSFAFNLLYKLTPGTTRLFHELGFDTSSNSNDFGFYLADQWETSWTQASNVDVSVSKASNDGIHIKITGIGNDLPGALGKNSTSTDGGAATNDGGGGGGGGCLIERAGMPNSLLEDLRVLRDAFLSTRGGRLLTQYYYHLFGPNQDTNNK